MTGSVPRAKGSDPRPVAVAAAEDERVGAAVIGSSGMTYRPVQDLGEGGTARAVLAYGIGSGGFSKLVVLKMLHRQLAEDPAAREMFEAEARLSARLNHPNLVQVHEVVDAAIPFLVMEYLDGKPLSRVFSSGGMTQAMLLTILAEGLVGLHHAHELCDFDGTPLNIVHRDVSPHNVFVTYDGAVKVLDFGIAKAAGGASNTETGEVKGKLAYMAPEQLLGQSIDRRADIFAAGCILWEAAVGARIWGQMSDAAVMHRLATGEIPRPDTASGMDPRLVEIIVKATATAPEDRYATALELQRDLAEHIATRWGAVSMRDVGAALAEIFKEERERNRKLLGSALSADPILVAAEATSRSKSGKRPAIMEDFDEVEAPPPPRRVTPLATAGIVAVLLGVGAWLWRPREGSPVAEATPAASATVHVRVRATPPEAAIEVDGQNRGAGSVDLGVPGDSQDHIVRVSAPGFTTEERFVKFARDLEVEIALEKAATKAEASSTAAGEANSQHPSFPRHVFPQPQPQAKPKPSASAAESPCSPPYYFSNGIKTFKPECL